MASNAVHKSLTLGCGVAHAFAVFTQQMGRWWPASHHIGKQAFLEIRIEPFEGGRWYEVDASDNTCAWGSVLAFEPPYLLRLAWHLSPDFTFDPDPDHASEIELRFIELGPNLTQFDFFHHHLECHGAGWEKLREAVDSKDGWSGILSCFEKQAVSPSS
jgi:uncharacterized protein YndB with AHSA1/START domain